MTPHYDWTPASEPPSDDRPVLVWALDDDGDGFVSIGLHWGGLWHRHDGVGDVSHWRELPEPPREE